VTTRMSIAVTGAGIAVPGLEEPADLLEPPADLLEPSATSGGFNPATGLRGREMRNKDRASRLALSAVAPALRDAGLLGADGYTGPEERTAVVVSTNFGNLDSVCGFADTIAEQNIAGLSPLGLPHTSSNAIAGWIAIRYRMRGPNLTVCNGPTSGIDALQWAGNLLAARRAETVVVVGVEPDTEPVARLLADGPGGPDRRRVLDGAAAVVLEPVEHATARGGPVRAVLTGCSRAADLPTAVDRVLGSDGPAATMWLGVALDYWEAAASPVVGATVLDLTERLGQCSGALGVLQCAAGAVHLSRGGSGAVLGTAGGAPGDDGAAAMLLVDLGAAS
jgi:3-oxoacyl-[acyl-carrier-protein] synthase II